MIKKTLISLTFACSLLVPALQASAQELRIGVVNTNRLLVESKMAKAAEAKLTSEFAARSKDFEAKAKQFDEAIKKYQKDAPTLSASQKEAREAELGQQQNELFEMEQKIREEMSARRQQELQTVMQKADQALQKIAADGKYDLIITEAVFVKPELDLTDQVLKALN